LSKHNISTWQGLHVVAKPIGPICNLKCEYCFYLEKQALFPAGEKYRMFDDVLRAYITNYIKSQPTPVVEFVWQGGEPTLLGIDFFKRVKLKGTYFQAVQKENYDIEFVRGSLKTE
jgi:sulfatase maturation enzyme AslB (radical SAM superfamily)